MQSRWETQLRLAPATRVAPRAALDEVWELEWVRALMPIAESPTNYGGRMLKMVRDALEAYPPPPAALAEELKRLVSPPVYTNSGSAGRTKRGVIQVRTRAEEACAALLARWERRGHEAGAQPAAVRAARAALARGTARAQCLSLSFG